MYHDRLLSALGTLLLTAIFSGCVSPIAAPSPGQSAAAATKAPSTEAPAAEAPATLDADTVARIDDMVRQELIEQPAPGLQMCIVKDGALVYSKGFGMADVENSQPMTPQSVLRQMSLSKPITAMAVMQLVEQGQVALAATVTPYLPDFQTSDKRSAEITVRMLLNHSSGLPGESSLMETPNPDVDPLIETMRGFRFVTLQATPGTEWHYSNDAYSLLGAIVQTVSGESFAAYMQQNWFTPLGMAHSTFVAEEVNPALLARGYAANDLGVVAPQPGGSDDRYAPGRGLWSSCEDMATLAQMMSAGGEFAGTRLLQPESIESMWEGALETGDLDAVGEWYGAPFANYGSGWDVGVKDGHPLVGHGGGGSGYNSRLIYAPADDLAVFVGANRKDPGGTLRDLAGDLSTDTIYMLLGIEP